MPYYERDGITIYHGDAREILPTLPPVDLVLTDPPYGIAFDTDYRRFTGGFGVPRTKHAPVHGDDAEFDPAPWLEYPRVVLWGATIYSDRLPCGTWLVWDKRFDNGTAFLGDGEAAWMKGGYGLYIKKVTSQGFVRPEAIQHPTQKPLALMRWCIEKAKCPDGGLVLDPFMGSGTTLVAARDLGRKAIGIEIEERYCEIAAKRLAQQLLPFA